MKSAAIATMFQTFSLLLIFNIATVNSQSFSTIVDELNPTTKQFLSKHCENFVIGKHNIDTTSPSTDIVFHCKNIELETITMRKCDSICINPTTCRQMIRFQNKPTMNGIVVKNRENIETLIYLPIGCECVVKNQRSVRQCRKQKLN